MFAELPRGIQKCGIRRPQSRTLGWLTVLFLLIFSVFRSHQAIDLSYSHENDNKGRSSSVTAALRGEPTPSKMIEDPLAFPLNESLRQDTNNDEIRLSSVKNKLKETPADTNETLFSRTRTPLDTAFRQEKVNARNVWSPIQTLKELEAFECVAWRQTANCSPRGKRQPARDTPCDDRILSTNSGYCEYRHFQTGEIRRLVATKCKSRASTMGFSCANITMLIRYNLLADEYKPTYPLSFATNQRDLLLENQLLHDSENEQSILQPPTSYTQGIAYVVYEELLLSVYAAIRALRSTGCELPIEIWYRKDETNTSHPLVIELTTKYGAYLRVLNDTRAIKFYTKLYAVFYSAFDNLLLLDADNFAAQDPTPLFTSKVYNDTGAVFWPDFWRPNRTMFHLTKKSEIWDLLGVPFVDMFEQESGQVLVNRVKHTKALHALLHYGLTEPHLPATFHLLWGDKDLFRFAWMRTNSSFHMIERPAGSAGLKAPHLNIFCGNTMVQHDPSGEIAFLHRNIMKFLPERNNTQKLWQYIQQYQRKQDLRYYEVRGDVDHRWFPQIRKCYGKRINYLRAYTLTPIEDFPFAQLEDEIIAYVLEGEKIIKQWARLDNNTSEV